MLQSKINGGGKGGGRKVRKGKGGGSLSFFPKFTLPFPSFLLPVNGPFFPL